MKRSGNRRGSGLIVVIVIIAIILMVYFSGGNNQNVDEANQNDTEMDTIDDPRSFTDTSIQGMERAEDIKADTEARNQELEAAFDEL